jgi:adenine-specific DNA-methyltransferase
MKKNEFGASLNKQEEILSFLKSDLPGIFSEGKIDCKKLKQTLGEEVDNSNERYGLSWAGKNNCFNVIQEQTTATLKPVKSESVDFDQTQNVFIEGDNLEALKVLQRSYYGKVKMIYIDPPYNTGGDFIYNDNFRKSKKDEMMDSGELDEDGNSINIDGFSLNRKDSNGHFHSDWLNMMYPRLFLARNLLCQEGVIFVSIDDNEVKNLRMIMDEIFGEENFLAEIAWQNLDSVKNDAKYFSDNHEYVLVYAKNKEGINILGVKKTDKQNNYYKNPDNDSRGNYLLTPIHAKSGTESGIYEYTFKNGFKWKPPQGTYPRFSRETLKKLEDDNRIYFGNKENATPQRKTFLNEVSDRMKLTTFWNYEFAGSTRQSNKELSDLLGKGMFDNPKPVKLIKILVDSFTINGKEDIVLDFFSGSGTTAHAVMQQNLEDGGNRKWICVQLPELCDEESEAYKAGYTTIAEIGKERIRRAGKKIEKENEKKVDIGFKVFKLDKSNFKIWQGKFENTEDLLSGLEDFVDNVEKGSKEENILFELILKSGLDLNVPIEEKTFEGNAYSVLDGGRIVVYLGKQITKELSEEIQKAKPEKFICLDGCFQNNDQLKTNISLQMEQEKIDFKVI